MPDESREPQDAPEEKPDYQEPKAEELPEVDPMGAAGGPAATDSDGSASDRDLKADFAEVDVEAVLAAVRELPITSWSYREDDPRVRHVGPMAQDFAAGFGVGQDDRHIHAVDANGVALAAIQALAARLEAAEARIAELNAVHD